MRGAALVLTGIVLGLAVGAWLWSSPGAAVAAAAPVAPPDDARVVHAEAEPPQAPSKSATAIVTPTPPSVAPVEQRTAAPALVSENDQLRREVAALRALVEEERTIDERDQGTPLAAPPGLPSRFGPDALRERISEALVQAGLEGAQVTSVDCTEYPCIVYGEGEGGPEEFDRLRATDALRGYADDRHDAFGWSFGDGTPERPRKPFFGLAMYPRPDANARGGALKKRITYRARQMSETFAH